jgi:hypothetical protein
LKKKKEKKRKERRNWDRRERKKRHESRVLWEGGTEERKVNLDRTYKKDR